MKNADTPVTKAAQSVNDLEELYRSLRAMGLPVDEDDAAARLRSATERLEKAIQGGDVQKGVLADLAGHAARAAGHAIAGPSRHHAAAGAHLGALGHALGAIGKHVGAALVAHAGASVAHAAMAPKPPALGKSAATDLPDDKAKRLVNQSRKLNGAAGAAVDPAVPSVAGRPTLQGENASVWTQMLRDAADGLRTKIGLHESRLDNLRQAKDAGAVKITERELAGLRQSHQRISQLLAEYESGAPIADPTGININAQQQTPAQQVSKSQASRRIMQAIQRGDVQREDGLRVLRLVDSRGAQAALGMLEVAQATMAKARSFTPERPQTRVHTLGDGTLTDGWLVKSANAATNVEVAQAQRELERQISGPSKAEVLQVLTKAASTGKLGRDQAALHMRQVDSLGPGRVWAQLPDGVKGDLS